MDRFLVISQRRAGTQMLERTLAHHPELETMVWNTGPGNRGPIHSLSKPVSLPGNHMVVFTHMWGEQYLKAHFGLCLSDFWATVVGRFSKVVVLVRENQLRRYLSVALAKQTGRWTVADRRAEHPMIRLEFSDFLLSLRASLEYTEEVIKAVPKAMVITYELLARPGSGVIQDLLGFLGVSYKDLNPTSFTKVQETRPPRQVISNWGPELEFKFRHYGMQGWLR